MALMGILGNFVSFLIVLGLILTPLTGIMIVDFLMNKKLYNFDVLKSNWRLESFIVWGLSCLVGFSTTAKASGGFELITLTHVPPFDALFVAAILQFLIIKFLNKKKN